MILKNFINLFNIAYLLLFLLYLFTVNEFLITYSIRTKFALFVVNLFVMIGIGLYYSLDGLIMLFFISELTIILIFIVLFSQLYSHYTDLKPRNTHLLVALLLLAANFTYYTTTLIPYSNFYSYYNVNLNDFYYIYNTYFEKYLLLTIFTVLIITLYSMFFILVYYVIKAKAAEEVVKKKKIYLLRKQNILHQNNYNTTIRIFKSKN